MKSKVKRLSIITAIICVAIALAVGSILIFNKNNSNENPAKGVLTRIVGTSTENTGASSSDIQEKGGAIYVGYGTEYEMTGGVISGHYNVYGGAVYIAKGGVFTMFDGIITDCEAEYGGAIYVENGGRCVIRGGEIFNNRSCSAPIFLESGAVLEIIDQSIIHDNQVVEKYYVNFFADDILIESRKVITNVYDLGTAVMPFTLDECSGYYLDQECKQPITNTLINFEENENVVDGELNLYTNIATLEEFEFTYDKTQKFYNIQIEESGLVKNLVMPACHEGIPVRRVKAALNLSNVVKSVKLSSNITIIHTEAFIGATGLTDIYLPDGVETIGESAFEGCTNLKTIRIPDSVYKMNISCFEQCTSLIGPIKIPEGETKVYNRMFYNCTSLTGVEIPEGVTEIGTNAFYECDAITSFDLPDSLQTIGTYAFIRCSGISEITIPEGVTELNQSTFSRCNNLITVNLPSTIKTMANYVFSNCTNLTNINLPESLTTMKTGVFSSCGKLQTIIIPIGVTSMGSGTFENCVEMQSIYCAAPEKPADWHDGWLGDCTATVYWSGVAIKTINFYVDGQFNSTLTVNADYVIEEDDMPLSYENCCGYFLDEYLTKTIPNGVIPFINNTVTLYTKTATNLNKLGFSLYEGDDTYSVYTTSTVEGEIVLPREYNDILVTKIDSCAFEDSNVTKVTLSDSIDTIVIDAFSHSTVSEIILHDNFKILQDAFYYCSNLEKIYISKNVEEIFDHAFEGVGENTVIYLQRQSQPAGYEDNWDYECSAELYWGASIENYINGDRQNTDFIINGTVLVEYIGTDENVVIPSVVTEIGEHAFDGADVVSVSIPNSVTKISSGAFLDCNSLTSITIPNSVVSIGDYAFSGCYELTSITIPKSLTTIEGNPFDLLTNITVEQGNTVFDTTAGLNALVNTQTKELVRVSKNTNYNLINDIVSIGEYAFSDCDLVNYVIPNSVTSIGDKAFSDCSSLTSITIPDSITSIGYRSFYDCSSLISIYIPASVTTISSSSRDNAVFYGCSSSLVIYCGASEKPSGWGTYWNYYSSTGTLTVKWGYTREQYEAEMNNIENLPTLYPEFTFSGSVITGYTGTDTNVVIPAGVTEIDDRAFYGNRTIISVTLPDSVTSIGDSAFNFCSSLTSITLPDGLTSIGKDAFNYCTSLTTITIPASVTSIYGVNNVFMQCRKLTSIIIDPNNTTFDTTPGLNAIVKMTTGELIAGCNATNFDLFQNVKILKQNSFCGCTFTNIVIPNTVQKIEGYAFQNCTNLTTITIPASVTSITGNMLPGCVNLNQIIIDSNSTTFDSTLGLNAIVNLATGELIAGCNGTNFALLQNVTSIRTSAFYNMKNINEITLPEGLVKINEYSFEQCTGLTSIYIPASVTTIDASRYSYSPFYRCSSSLVIYCGASEKPSGWDTYWNYYSDTGTLTVKWGYTRAQYEAETQTGASSFAPVKQNQEIFENIYDMQAVDVALNNLKFAYIKEN